MKEEEIRQLLDTVGVRPNKQLGQNFLTDESVARGIVDQLQLEDDDAVVEVGPGAGSLTKHLINKVRRLILIEFDAKLAEGLKRRFADIEHVEVHHQDAAQFDRRFLFKHRRVKFLGNLPYSSGGAILRNLLQHPHPFERAVIMLQKEVIDRLGAQPGSKNYGLLSLRMQVDWQIEPLQVVPPEAFHPRPSIDSAVAVLTPRIYQNKLTFDRKLFEELIRRGFSQRRKQLKKHLPNTVAWEEVISQLNLSPSVRAEELDLYQWIDLCKLFDLENRDSVAQSGDEIFDVVDETDAVIGQATRAEVHAKNLIHRAIHIFVKNRKGDVWLQKRSQFKDKNAGLWDSSVSGHVDSGETYLEAAQRELGEEIGLNLTDQTSLNLCKIYKPCEENGWEHIALFEISHKGAVKFPAHEIEAMMPFPVEEIRTWIQAKPEDFSPAFRIIFQDYISSDR